jgi:small acid-soluble spore protein H (minor)
MDFHRANQILHSPNTIEVFYRTTPVWIESLQEGKNMANVTLKDGSNEKTQLPITELIEGKIH